MDLLLNYLIWMTNDFVTFFYLFIKHHWTKHYNKLYNNGAAKKEAKKKTVKQNKNKQTNTEKSEIQKFNMTLLLANKCLTPQMKTQYCVTKCLRASKVKGK